MAQPYLMRSFASSSRPITSGLASSPWARLAPQSRTSVFPVLSATSLHPSVSRLRRRMRLYSSSSSSSGSSESPQIGAVTPGSSSQPIGQIEPRLSMTFTCTANGCGHRSTHEFAKRSYEKGIVLVQCPECKNRHLIADHLGWFKESTDSGRLKTVEDLLKAKGETIRKGRVNFDGDIEYTE